MEDMVILGIMVITTFATRCWAVTVGSILGIGDVTLGMMVLRDLGWVILNIVTFGIMVVSGHSYT